MSHYNTDYVGIMRRAGHRVTAQRVFILDAVCEGNGHTTLGQIYARLHKVDSTIDRSTVYRTLKLFIKLGLAVSADTGSGETLYEIPHTRHHHHLVCRVCGQQWEVEQSALNTAFDSLYQSHGFRVESDHLILFGTCAQCASRMDEN